MEKIGGGSKNSPDRKLLLLLVTPFGIVHTLHIAMQHTTLNMPHATYISFYCLAAKIIIILLILYAKWVRNPKTTMITFSSSRFFRNRSDKTCGIPMLQTMQYSTVCPIEEQYVDRVTTILPLCAFTIPLQFRPCDFLPHSRLWSATWTIIAQHRTSQTVAAAAQGHNQDHNIPTSTQARPYRSTVLVRQRSLVGPFSNMITNTLPVVNYIDETTAQLSRSYN